MQDAAPERADTGSIGSDPVRTPSIALPWPLAAVGIWLAAQVVPVLLVAPFVGERAGTGTADGEFTAALWAGQVASWTVVCVLVWWVNRLLGGTAGDLGIGRTAGRVTVREFAIGAGFGLAAVPVTLLVDALLRLAGLGGDTLAPYRDILAVPWGAVLLTVGAVLFAPVAEELFYRGFIQGRAVGARTGRAAVVPIVIVAAVFSVVHLNPAAALQLFLFGCLLGWLRQWRGALAAPVGAHMALNATTMTAILTGLAA